MYVKVRTCGVCAMDFSRRDRYVNHISNLRSPCGNNIHNVVQLLEMHEYDIIGEMYTYTLSTPDNYTAIIPLLRHTCDQQNRIHYDNVAHKSHSDLVVAHTSLIQKYDDVMTDIQARVNDIVEQDVAEHIEEKNGLHADLRVCTGSMYRLMNRMRVPKTYKMVAKELTPYIRSKIPSIPLEYFKSICTEFKFMPTVVFQKCVKYLYGNTLLQAPMIGVKNISQQIFVTVDSCRKVETREKSFLSELLQDISIRVSDCVIKIQANILEEYAISRIPYNSMQQYIKVDLTKFRELAEIEMSIHSGHDTQIIEYSILYNSYTILLDQMKALYLHENSQDFNSIVTLSLSGYVKDYLKLIHIHDMSTIQKYVSMHHEYSYNGAC